MRGTRNVLDAKRLVFSPCSIPGVGVEEALAACRKTGFCRFEVFSEWAGSRFDWSADPGRYVELGKKYGVEFSSMHLPILTDDSAQAVDQAVMAARFARAIGVGVVLFKAKTREIFAKVGRPFLNRIEGLGVTPVLQNHVGTAISTLEDFREVIKAINDPRMKTLHEVGMFHSIGVSWQQGYELLGESIALVHIKDQVGTTRVPFGEGEVDLRGLFGHLRSVGYAENIVVEMEVCQNDVPRTLQLMRSAREHCERLFAEVNAA